MKNCIPLYAHELKAMAEHMTPPEIGKVLDAVAKYMMFGVIAVFEEDSISGFAFDMIRMRMDDEEETMDEGENEEDAGARTVQLLRLSDFMKSVEENEDE